MKVLTIRQNPSGRRDWTEADIDNKFKANERKLQVLTFLRKFGESYFGSLEIAANLNVTQKHASMILLRLKRQGLIIPVDVAIIPSGAGRDPILYSVTEELIHREQLLRVKVGHRASKKQGDRQKRSLEL